MGVSRAASLSLRYYLQKIYSLTGTFPLFFFLLLQFIFATLLLFGSKASVRNVVSFQGHPLVIGFELVFITIPLLFHFLYGLTFISNSRINVFNYSYSGNWRYVFQRICSVGFLMFLLFHVYQLFQIYFTDLMGYQFFKGMLWAHETIIGMILYWLGVLCGTYYFCIFLWGFMIDWGIASVQASQKFFIYLFMAMFLIVLAYVCYIVGYQLV